MAMSWPGFEEYGSGKKKKEKTTRRSADSDKNKDEVFRLNKVHAFLICKSYLTFSCSKEARNDRLFLRNVRKTGNTPDWCDVL
jgi:hypothetical protein